ncbi:MAG: hypothetical protein ACRC5M_04925 [Anaeroplasmataceae bacterium]
MNNENIFSSMNKSFKLFRILDRNDRYLDRNIKLKTLNGVCFMPLVDTREEIADLANKFFGANMYHKMFKNYLFNYKFIYRPSLVAGVKTINQGNQMKVRDEATILLGKLTTIPTHKVLNNRNAIVDYSDQYRLIKPTPEMLTKMPVLDYAEYIFPEILTRFGVSYEKPELFKWTAQYVSSQVKPYLSSNYSSVIIPVNVDVMENKLANQYLDYNIKMTIQHKKDIRSLKFLSIIRAVYQAYVGDFEDVKSEEYKFYLSELSTKNVVFLFHNKHFAFSVNFTELREKKVNFRQFRNLFKSRLISLISNNAGISPDENIDKLIAEEKEEDKEETNKIEKTIDLNVTPTIQDTEKKLGPTKKINDLIIDDVEDKIEEEAYKIINESINKKPVNLDYAKKSKKLMSLIDKMEEVESEKIFEAMNENDIKPVEEIEEETKKSEEVKVDNISKLNNVKVIGKVAVAKDSGPMIDDGDEEDIVEYAKEEDEVYDEDGFLVTKTEETPMEEESADSLDDIPDDIVESNTKTKITVSSDGEISDKEKKEILKEISKRTQPQRSEKQMRRIATVREKYKSIKLDDNRTLEEIMKNINSKKIETVVNDSPTIVDKSVTTSNLQDFERSYLKNTMQQDIINTLKSFGNDDKSLPMHIIDYKEVDTSDRFNKKKTVSVKFEDDNQKQHNIKFDLPMPGPDGILLINGNKKVLKKQITLRPLIKINPSKLAINTFYNKVLMFRQGTVLNRKVVLLKKIVETVLKEHESTFTLNYGNNLKTNKNYLTTIEYDELAKMYHKFLIGKKGNRTVVFFSQTEIRNEIKRLELPHVPKASLLPVAIDYSKKEIIELDMYESNKSVIDLIMKIIEEKSYYPEIDELKEKVKAPKRRVFSRLTIQSFDIPTITFLSALFGLSNLVRMSGLKYTFTSERLEKGAIEKSWLSIPFKDGTLYYPEYPYNNSLLFNGLSEMVTEEYYFDQFDEHLPYMDYCAKSLKTRNVFKGWFAFKDLFIDDTVTREILRDENLPTDFLELFLYANDLLVDNSYNNETDAKSYRIRSFELYSVALYKSIAEEYRKYIQKEGRANTSISIPQDAVIKKIVESQILETYDTINPINELKMKSGCSVKGNGLSGANTKHGYGMDRRAFGEDAVGIYAESNVDNHNIGIVKELTSDARILNTRGYLKTTKDPGEIQKITAAQRMAPEELIMPAITKYDSPNRVAFSSTQWKHTMPITGGGDPPLIGSGFEKVVAKNVGDTYCIKVDTDCTVKEINEELQIITVTTKSGENKTYHYSTNYHKNGDMMLENNLELNVKVGQKLKFNDILAYSKEFFIKTPGNDVTFTMGRLCKVALMDDYFTEEDSSLLSEQLSKKMASTVTHAKTISISGKANIIRSVKVGDHVKDGEVIMLFEDEKDEDVSNVDITEILEMLGDADQSAIEKMRYHAPKANATGVISKIDVYWTGELEDMSDSVRKFVSAYIKKKKEKIKYEETNTGKESLANLEIKKVVANYGGKVNGKDIDENNGVIIEYLITHTLPYGPGDKLSFYPAIKSITAQVVPSHLCPYAEDGNIDAVMGLVSLSARQVNSPYFLGAAGKILLDMSKRIASDYLGK